MKCPKCGDRSETLQTITSGTVTSRRRRCLNPGCLTRFKTHEQFVNAEPEITTEAVMKSLNLQKRRSQSTFDAEAIAAAIAVDKRRAQLRRDAKRRTRDDQWESDAWDRAPTSLTRESLRREIDGY